MIHINIYTSIISTLNLNELVADDVEIIKTKELEWKSYLQNANNTARNTATSVAGFLRVWMFAATEVIDFLVNHQTAANDVLGATQ